MNIISKKYICKWKNSYCCNKITTNWIQISCQNWNGFFSNISHQRMIYLAPTVSRSKTKWYKCQKNKKLSLHSWLSTYLSNFDKWWSDAHFASFWFYYYCIIKWFWSFRDFSTQHFKNLGTLKWPQFCKLGLILLKEPNSQNWGCTWIVNTAKRILERLGIWTLWSFVKI